MTFVRILPGKRGDPTIALRMEGHEMVGYASTLDGSLVRHSLPGEQWIPTKWHDPLRWRKFTGTYLKMFYDVRLWSGEVIEHCWPNAGMLCALNCEEGSMWGKNDNVYFRKSITHPLGGFQ